MRLAALAVTLLLALAAPVSEVPPAPSGRAGAARPPSRRSADDTPAGLSRGDWAQIQRTIRESEYHAAPVTKPGEARALRAPNRQQGYRTTFRRDGIEIAGGRSSRKGSRQALPGGAWRLAVAVTGYGYEGDVHPLPAAEPTAEKERVEYRRGPVTEWYLNRPGGLEQGFTITEPETRRKEPIALAMAVEGDLEVRVDEAGVASFRDGAGETRVRYADLAAWDADGRPLASRLEASDGELRVVVEARGARFPVTVDPTFVQEARLEGHGDPVGVPGSRAGQSVSVSGDTAVVGAFLDDTAGGANAGSAYVFVRSGTVWSEQQHLVASDGAADDNFGISVSVSGDTVVIGAYGDDTAGGVDAGSAYVFVRSGTVWSEQQHVFASDGAAGDNFGVSVSVAGDTVVVGALLDDTAGGLDAGSAYVFVRSGTVWSEQQHVFASDGGAGDQFGQSVSVSGDTAVVGAYADDTTGGGDAGSAYVFVRSGTVWSEQQKLVASDGAAGDYFGWSVSVAGDTAVVGAPASDTAGGVDAGSAYVFVRSGTVWSQQQKLVASDGAAVDFFGGSVSVSGDTAVVGAPFDDTAGGADAGSAYVFVRSGTVWSQQQKLVASNGTADDQFGYSVSVSGDTALVGAPATKSGFGSAYVFVRSGTVWSEQQKLVASDGTANDQFGYSVSVSGDTAVVGALLGDAGGGAAGSAYVFVRSGTVWSQQQKLVASDGAADFSWSVSVSGDTAVVGAPATMSSGFGSAYVFVRSGMVWSEQQKLVASDGGISDQFGYSVSVSGDTAVVGADLDDIGVEVDVGSAYVFVRSGTVWSEQQKLMASDAAGSDYFGYSVSVSGDTAVVGAPFDDTPYGQNAGSAYVFVRSGTVWGEEQHLGTSDGSPNDNFGYSVSVSGDTAVVGAAFDDTADGFDAGSAYVFARSGIVWSEQHLVASDGAANDAFGYSVSVSGATAVVGAYLDDTTGGFDAGSAYVFRAPSADLSVTKTDGVTSVVPGQPVTYTTVATNAGPDPVSGATVADTLPAALTGATWTCTASSGASCAAGGSGNINDTVTLPVAGTVTYTLTATIDPAATGSLANTATVTVPPSLIDPDLANNAATDTDTLTPQADLAVAKSDSPDPVAAGGTLTYTIQVTNLGPSNASGMSLVDALPASVTFVSSTPGPPTCVVIGPVVTCNLGALAPSGVHTVTVTVTAGPPGSISNTAAVIGNETDPVSANDSDTEPTQVIVAAESELVHGSSLLADLEALGGVADEDLYRIGQKPYSSYEVVVDATGGDIGTGQGPAVDRVASDATTVLQSSQAAGAGASRSLRFENDTAFAVNDQYVRVGSAGCTTACGPEDVYRIRAWDTTLLVPRFNNSGTQITVLVLQNTTGGTASGHAQFWNTAGTLVGTQAFTMGPRAAYVVNTSTIPGVAGVGGAITLSHDGPYAGLTGKAVAVEPATGFTFDSALEPRRR